MSEYQPRNSRDLLTDLGVGRFNATMMIEPLMMAPSTTAVESAPIMLLVQHIQQNLNAMGASPPIPTLGILDEQTAYYLAQVAGSDFLHLSWFEVCRRVIAARRRGVRLSDTSTKVRITAKPQGIGSFDLPDVPGGAITYAVGTYLLYRALIKKKRG